MANTGAKGFGNGLFGGKALGDKGDAIAVSLILQLFIGTENTVHKALPLPLQYFGNSRQFNNICTYGYAHDLTSIMVFRRS